MLAQVLRSILRVRQHHIRQQQTSLVRELKTKDSLGRSAPFKLQNHHGFKRCFSDVAVLFCVGFSDKHRVFPDKLSVCIANAGLQCLPLLPLVTAATLRDATFAFRGHSLYIERLYVYAPIGVLNSLSSL